MPCVLILNGANLNMLGLREPDIYGKQTLPELEESCRARARALALEVVFAQDNCEGALVSHIQRASQSRDGLVINPGAYAHSSIAIRDALQACSIPTIEVHLSNLYRRESFRHRSVTAAAADGLIVGLGVQGYHLALAAIAQRLEDSKRPDNAPQR